MIGEILGGAHRLDDWLRRTLGRPYHAALGAGLVLEIVGRIRELHEAPAGAAAVPLALLMLLSLLLLVHQIGELSEHAERRRRRQLPDA